MAAFGNSNLASFVLDLVRIGTGDIRLKRLDQN